MNDATTRKFVRDEPTTLVLKGSPAIHSNSLRLAAAILEKVGGSHQVIDLYKAAISPCNACGACYEGDSCPIQDAAPEIVSLIAASDLVLVAAPLHFLSPPAPVIALLSRFQPFWMARQRGVVHPLMPDRSRFVALAVTGGGEYRDMFKPAASIVAAGFSALKIPFAGIATAINTDSLPISQNEFAIKEARELGDRINQALGNGNPGSGGM